MSRVFSLQTVLRMTPNVLLKQFFEKVGVGDLGIDWSSLKERDVGLVFTKLTALQKRVFDEVESILHQVFDLACESGINALLEAGELCGYTSLAQDLPADGGPYHKVMWVWLHRRPAFQKALPIYRVDNLSWWRKRTDIPPKNPDTSPEALARLERELTRLYLSEQGRGMRCTIETLIRGDTVYLFGHPDDYVQDAPVHDEEGKLSPGNYRQTFLIVFAYTPSEHCLELFAKASPKFKAKLEEAFVRIILGETIGEFPRPTYSLEHLK